MSSCGFENDPMMDDLYTQNIYPGVTDTYDVGSASLRYDEGYFRLLHSDNITGDITLGGAIGVDESISIGGYIDWEGGNVIYVPLTGDIQTYVNNAVAGDTLVLASGKYTITSNITISKQLNIVGQGNAGFATTPVTPSHGTIISCATNDVTAFQIDNDNIRIARMSIDMTGDNSLAVDTGNNLSGLVFTNIDVIISCSGIAQAFTIDSSNAVLRELTFYVTSSNGNAAGVLVYNNGLTTQDSVVDAFNVTGTAVGGTTTAFAFACWNNNSSNTITLNLSNSVCRALAGTSLDVAVASYSVTTNNSIVNAYMCTFDGQDYDAYQTGTNQLNVGGSVLVNNRTLGTITYRATMASGTGVFGGSVNMTAHQIVSVADPTLAQDAATKNYVDTYSSYGEIYITTPTATVCTLADTYYLVSGNTTSDELRGFTASNERLTYIDTETRVVHVSAAISVSSDTNNVVLSTKVYKNGAAHAASLIQRKISTAGDVGAFAILTLVSMSTNDYIEIYIACDNAGTEITFNCMTLNVFSIE
jgi:hypothetical protein